MLYSNKAIDNVPVNDLQEVVKLALEMQEAARIQRDEGQSEEQIREAILNTAKEMGITQEYLNLAAAQTQRVRDEQHKAKMKWAASAQKNIRITFLLSLFLSVGWLLFKHIGLWRTSALLALPLLIFYIKWRFIDLNHLRPVKPLRTTQDYLDYYNGKRD